LLGQGGVPSDASAVQAVMLHVQTLNGTSPGGFLWVYPTGSTRPTGATLTDVSDGSTDDNTVIVPLGTSGQVSFYNGSTATPVDLTVDVQGYVTAAGATTAGATYSVLHQTRLFDTSTGVGGKSTPLASGSPWTFPLLGAAGVVPTSGVSAVVLNLGAKNASGNGYLAAGPTGQTYTTAWPRAQAYSGSGSAQQMAVVQPGTSGQITLYTNLSSVNIFADVEGYYLSAGAGGVGDVYVPVPSKRLVDTRSNLGITGALTPGRTATGVQVTGVAGVPTTADAVALAYTTLDGTASGAVTAWTDGATRPSTNTIAVMSTRREENVAFNNPSSTGSLSIYNSTGETTDLLIDVQGFYQFLPDLPLTPTGLSAANTSTLNPVLSAVSAGVCSPPSETLTFTVTAADSLSGAETTTLSGSTLADADGPIESTACSGSPCPLSMDNTLTVGYDGASHFRAAVLPDLSAIPRGSRITGATLSLIPISCLSACDASDIAARALDAPWDSATTGSDLATATESGDIATSDNSNVNLDITSIVQAWVDGDQEQDGLVLALDSEASAVGGEMHGSSQAPGGQRPTLTINYIPPTNPTPPLALNVQAGSGGAYIEWQPPTAAGSSESATSFAVTVTAPNGTVVKQASTSDDAMVVTGLTNGDLYLVSVVAATDYGTSTAVTQSVTPASIGSDVANYINPSEDFVAAQQSLMTGQYEDAGTAAAVTSTGSAFVSILDAESPALTAASTQLTATSAQMAINSIGYTDELVVSSGDEVTVYETATVDETTTTAGDPTVGSEVLQNQLTFASGNSPILASEVDAQALAASPLQPDAASAISVTLGNTGNFGIKAGAPINLTTDASSDYVNDPNPANQFSGGAGKTVIDYSGAAQWALDNVFTSGNNGYSNDCSDFVSRALHRGGGMLEKFGWDWRSDHNWYKNWYHPSYTWGGSYHLADFFWVENSARWLPYWNDGQPGDVIFFNFTGSSFSGIGHAAMITKNSNGNLFITQHSHNLRNYPLLTVARETGHANMTTWIAEAQPSWYSEAIIA
jgi:hypothetical protein